VGRMFAVFCPYQESRVLLSPGNILAMETRANGIALRYRCWCGHEGWHVITRADRPTAPVPTPAVAPTPAPVAATGPIAARTAGPAIPARC
jgi:hypothetical protein